MHIVSRSLTCTPSTPKKYESMTLLSDESMNDFENPWMNNLLANKNWSKKLNDSGKNSTSMVVSKIIMYLISLCNVWFKWLRKPLTTKVNVHIINTTGKPANFKKNSTLDR